MAKKRAALCFSGQMRNVQKGFHDHIQPNILVPNKDDWDIDVFIHTWFQQEDVGKNYIAASNVQASAPISANVLTVVHDLYNPQKMLVEKQIEFDEKSYGQRKASLIVPWKSLSKCFSLQRSIELKQDHEKTAGFEYDLVMTMRFDLGVKSPVVFNTFDLLAANMSTHGVNQDIGVDVTHCIMNSKNANTYATILNHVEDYFNSGTLFCDEHFFHRHLEHFQIPINRTSLLNDYILVRT